MKMAAYEATLKTRQQEIADIWKENTWLYAVGGFLVGVMFFPFLQLAITDIADLLGGLVPEAVGIIFTVVFIDVLYRRREEKHRIKDLQEQLVRDASSLVNDVAVNAVHQIRKRGWLEGDDGLLKGANLSQANLSQAKLEYANLEGVSLVIAHLEKAKLYQAKLEGARLGVAHLEGASLWKTHLEAADLTFAHLEGADLALANLKGADLRDATFDARTILPDESRWTPDTDLSRFTNPQHPDFWRSDDPDSPAYRGKGKL
jgi:hypothetical protein